MSDYRAGPWNVSELDGAPDTIVDEKGWHVCFFYPADAIQYSGATLAEHQANARIIAAAPEMAELLQQLVDACLASDFNEHWTPYREAQALLERINK